MAESDVQADPPEPSRRRKPSPDRRVNEDDDYESRKARRARREREEDEYYDDREDRPTGVETLIPYKNPKALIGYYLGVFSLIPAVGALLGPAALILGILGLRTSRAYPTAGGTGHSITALVLGSLATLGNWTCLGLMFFGMLAR